jgi:hypothetical protein
MITDKDKINYIRITTQVDNLMRMLTAINKEDLKKMIEITPDNLKKDKGSYYPILNKVLEFYNQIEIEAPKKE